MINQIKNQAFAQYTRPSVTSYVINNFAKTLLIQKSAALEKGLLITDDLIAEAESFIERNACVKQRNDSYCAHCLKAHIIRKAEELGLTGKTIKYLNEIMPGNVGHEGYYLDNDELREV